LGSHPLAVVILLFHLYKFYEFIFQNTVFAFTEFLSIGRHLFVLYLTVKLISSELLLIHHFFIHS